jgi:hypothetical protein
LFGVVKKGPRRYLEHEPIASVEGVDIHYTGQRLDQGDLDVWEAVLHIARQQGLGLECRFTAYAMLKLLNITDSGKNRETLYKRLLRLKANGVGIKQGRFSYVGSLIDEVYREEETHEYVIRLNSKLHALFEKDQWTALDWAVRLELAGHPLAQWQHGFYATHAQPYPISVAKLHILCGSEDQNLFSFRQNLRYAFDAVTAACEKYGQSFSAEIRDDDLVYIDRQPSRSQQRHLYKKAKKPTSTGQRQKAMTPVCNLLKPKK